MLPLVPTYPGIMYSESESETEDERLSRRIADTEVDAIQSAFRIMSIQKGELDPLRVIVIHSVDPLFLDESGKPNINFIERELNMVSFTNEVFYVNNEESIQNALDWAKCPTHAGNISAFRRVSPRFPVNGCLMQRGLGAGCKMAEFAGRPISQWGVSLG